MLPLFATLLLIFVYFGFSFPSKRVGEVGISIKNVEASYTFKVSFYPLATPEVTTYMDSCTSILRKENAKLHIKISGGNLTITADKLDNSPGAMSHIRNMCHGIGDHVIQY